MEGIFTLDALANFSLYGEPPTGNNQRHRPALDSKAVDMIISNYIFFILTRRSTKCLLLILIKKGEMWDKESHYEQKTLQMCKQAW